MLTQFLTENFNDEESSLETSTLGSTTISSYDIPNVSCATFFTNTSNSSNTLPVEPQTVSFTNLYHTKHRVNK